MMVPSQIVIISTLCLLACPLLTPLIVVQDKSVTAADLVGEPAPQGGMSAIGNLFARGPGAEQRRLSLSPCLRSSGFED